MTCHDSIIALLSGCKINKIKCYNKKKKTNKLAANMSPGCAAL